MYERRLGTMKERNKVQEQHLKLNERTIETLEISVKFKDDVVFQINNKLDLLDQALTVERTSRDELLEQMRTMNTRQEERLNVKQESINVLVDTIKNKDDCILDTGQSFITLNQNFAAERNELEAKLNGLKIENASLFENNLQLETKLQPFKTENASLSEDNPQLRYKFSGILFTIANLSRLVSEQIVTIVRNNFEYALTGFFACYSACWAWLCPGTWVFVIRDPLSPQVFHRLFHRPFLWFCGVCIGGSCVVPCFDGDVETRVDSELAMKDASTDLGK